MNSYSDTCPVLGVSVAVTDMDKTIAYLTVAPDELRGQYICVSNSHTLVMAHDDPAYMHVQNSAVMVLPDGKPLSVRQRRKGRRDACRVSGPDVMTELVSDKYNGYRHFFYGSTEETLNKLKNNLIKNNPGIQIAGMYSPPFRPLTDEENADVVEMINASKPDFVWVGLGAPKQEVWMYEHSALPNVPGNYGTASDASAVSDISNVKTPDRSSGSNTSVADEYVETSAVSGTHTINALMLGVGAAFDFHAGTVKRAPLFMQRIGLEWLYRLFQDPKRLFKRYLITNTKFIIYSLKDK